MFTILMFCDSFVNMFYQLSSRVFSTTCGHPRNMICEQATRSSKCATPADPARPLERTSQRSPRPSSPRSVPKMCWESLRNVPQSLRDAHKRSVQNPPRQGIRVCKRLASDLRSRFALAGGFRAVLSRRLILSYLLVSCRLSTSTASSRSPTVRRNPFCITEMPTAP